MASKRINYRGEQWRLVEAKLKERIEELREQLENPQTEERDTLLIRGRIAELRETLYWPDEFTPE